MKNKIKNALNYMFGKNSPGKKIDIDEMSYTIPLNLTIAQKESLYKGTPIGTIKVENVHEDSKDEPEEWIWVKGYKGTDNDMKCRDYQFELGKQHDMPEDAEIEECTSGFHLCKDLKHVYNYYDVGNGNRFFKVKALVRKSDYEGYGRPKGPAFWSFATDKLVSKSIIFVEELTADEILKVKLNGWENVDLESWSDELKQLAINFGYDKAIRNRRKMHLMELGYSEALTMFIMSNCKYDRACEVAAISEDISIDVRVAMIFTGCDDD